MQLPLRLERPLAILDLETTGLSPAADRIVELAVLRISPGGDVLERVRRFDPEIPIPPEATAVHGITDEDVAGKPPFAARARSLAALLDPCDLAGFNLRRFDLPMLVAEFRRAGIVFDVSERCLVDIQAIFHREEPRDLSAAARFYLGREAVDPHSALGDVRTTSAVLAAQLERYGHLPRDVAGLDRYCDEFSPFETEVERWFELDDDGTCTFRRGKHRGRSLHEVAESEPDYLRWMLSDELSDFGEELRAVVSEALDRVWDVAGDGPRSRSVP